MASTGMSQVVSYFESSVTKTSLCTPSGLAGLRKGPTDLLADSVHAPLFSSISIIHGYTGLQKDVEYQITVLSDQEVDRARCLVQ